MHFPTLELRHWALLIYISSALYVHLRGRVRFKLARALTDFTVMLAPINVLMYLFSRTPRGPYIDVAQFPELVELQKHWPTIRDEALRLNDEGYIRAAAGYTDVGFNSFFRTGWKRFYLTWYGKDLASAQALCPQTVALLKNIGSVKAAMFASLPPGARLVRHRDPYAGSLRFHLGLQTPNDPGCYIEVDGERYHWRDGEAVMFDETYIHTAANTTEQQRVILFCDIERPLWGAPLRAFNRLFARHFMAAASTQNVNGEPIGGINKVFAHAYKLRAAAKEFKRGNYHAYYVLKWLGIAVLVWAIFW